MFWLRVGLLVRNDNFNNGRRNVNANIRPDNCFKMAPSIRGFGMKTYRHLFDKLCSYENLLLAFQKARKRKTLKPYVIEFEKDLQNNLYRLQWELMTHTYQPKPLTHFTVREPKTRKISASDFRDRVIHHALINIIGPIFESRFIHDTYANRKGKGTKGALDRFEKFMRQATLNGRLTQDATDNNQIIGYALKADIYHYFDSVSHEVMLSIISKRVKDQDVLWLVKVILAHHKSAETGKGMPLGNQTSQFFANLYLSELDYFIKHTLRVKHYIRYVDDFIILSRSREELDAHQVKIKDFLFYRLKLTLHPQKTQIKTLKSGITLLGFREFYHYRLLKKSNQRRIFKRLNRLQAIQKAGGGSEC
jgi:retron-type reverse transcriptase